MKATFHLPFQALWRWCTPELACVLLLEADLRQGIAALILMVGRMISIANQCLAFAPVAPRVFIAHLQKHIQCIVNL